MSHDVVTYSMLGSIRACGPVSILSGRGIAKP